MLFGRTDRYPSGIATHPLSREDVYTDLRSAHNTHRYGVFVYTPLSTRCYATYLGTVLLFHVPGTVTLFQLQLLCSRYSYMSHVPCYMSLCTEHTQHTQHVPCSSSLNRYFVTQQTQCSMFHIRIFCLRHILRDGCSHVLITNMFVNLREVTGQSGDLIAFAWTFLRNVHFLDHISTLRPQGKQLDAPYAHLLGLPATQTTGERPGAWGDYQVTPNPSNRKEGKHTVVPRRGGFAKVAS